MPPKIGANVRLGGKTRTLRYTAPTLLRAQQELATDRQPDGPGLQEVMFEIGGISFRHITVMVWAGLLHDDADLTVDQAAEMIEPPMSRLIQGIADAMKPWIAVDEADADEEAEPAKKKGSPAPES